jgi:predicted transcriptional regulator
MTQKLSPHKVSKMMALYFDGYLQSEIANKLKINQSTVSLYVSKLESLVEQQGVKAVGEEFGIMDQVETLHTLAAELKKAKFTVEEAKVGLKMARML